MDQIKIEELIKVMDEFFARPNWENRIGSWTDINDGLLKIFEKYKRYKEKENINVRRKTTT